MHDFAWWSGLSVADAKRSLEAIGPELEPVVDDDTTYWTAPIVSTAPEVAPIVHLLPNYDEHVVSYRNHAHSLDPAARDALRARTDGPLDVHLIARDGLVVGAWKRKLERGSAIVSLDLLVELEADERAALGSAVEAYAAFIGMPVGLVPRA